MISILARVFSISSLPELLINLSLLPQWKLWQFKDKWRGLCLISLTILRQQWKTKIENIYGNFVGVQTRRIYKKTRPNPMMVLVFRNPFSWSHRQLKSLWMIFFPLKLTPVHKLRSTYPYPSHTLHQRVAQSHPGYGLRVRSPLPALAMNEVDCESV